MVKVKSTIEEEKRLALVRGLKETARVALLAAVANLLVVLGTGRTDWRAIAIGALIAAYNGASKYVALHPELSLKGLYPF